jgi:hypothetical protein
MLEQVVEESEFDFRQGQEIFLFSITSKPALGPTQPPVQWVPGPASPELKRQGREADLSPRSSAEIKNSWTILPFLHTSSWRGT